jgi:hypothetical protein
MTPQEMVNAVRHAARAPEDQRTLHAAIGQHQVRGHAGLRLHVAVDDDRSQAIDEVQRLFFDARHRRRMPAQRIGWSHLAFSRAGLPPGVRQRLISPGHHARLAPVHPGATVVGPRRCESTARQQLGVQPLRRALRAVAASRQGAGHRLALELVVEATLVAQRVHASSPFRAAAMAWLSTSKLPT